MFSSPITSKFIFVTSLVFQTDYENVKDICTKSWRVERGVCVGGGKDIGFGCF